MTVLNSLNEVRKLVSSNETPPIEELIDSGSVPRIVELQTYSYTLLTKDLDQKTVFDCRYQAAWIITNIVSGTREQTETVVSLGVVKILNENIVENINESYELVDQAVWAISNIAGDIEACRDMVIDDDGLERIIFLLDNICDLENYTLKEENYIGILRNIAWLTSNLCRGNRKGLSTVHITRCLKISVKLMCFEDKNVVIDSLWAISHAIGFENKLIDCFFESGAVERIFSMLESVCRKITGSSYDESLYEISNYSITSLLRIVGNVIAGDNNHVTFFLQYKGSNNSPCLLEFLGIIFTQYTGSKLDRIRKEICWIFSNICASEVGHLRELMKYIIYNIIFDALVNQRFYIKVEACWGVIHSCDKLKIDRDLYEVFAQKSSLKAIAEALESTATLPDIQKGMLCAITKMLDAGIYYANMDGDDSKVLRRMAKYKVLDAVRYLMASENPEICDAAMGVNARYFENTEFE